MALYIQISSFYKDTSHIGLRTHSNPVYLVQFSRSVMSESLWPHGLQHAVLPVHHQLLELTQTHVLESVMPSNRLIFCCPLLLLPSIPHDWKNIKKICWSVISSYSPQAEACPVLVGGQGTSAGVGDFSQRYPHLPKAFPGSLWFCPHGDPDPSQR